jgi:GAF domain
VRAGVRHHVNVIVSHTFHKSLVGEGINSYAVLHAFKVFTLLLFTAVGTFLVLVRPRRLTWLFYLFCIGPTVPSLAAITVLLNLPMPLGFAFNLLRMTLILAGLYGFAAFALCFPNDSAVGWRRTVQRAVLVFMLPYWLFNVYAWFAEGSPGQSSDLHAANAFLGPIMVLPLQVANFLSDQHILGVVQWVGPLAIAMVSMFGMYRASEPQERRRLQWAVAGILMGYTTLCTGVILSWFPITASITPACNGIFQVMAVFAPVALGYAILKHRVIDVRFVLNRAVVFIAIACVLAGALAGLDLLFTTFFVNSRLQIGIDFVVISLMTLILRSGFQKLVVLVNHAFFPRRQQRMLRLRELTNNVADGQDELAPLALTAGTCDVLDLASAALFLRTPDNGFVRKRAVGWRAGTAWHLLPGELSMPAACEKRARSERIGERTWLEINVPTGPARPTLAISLISSKRVVGLVLYGAHTNGLDIDPDELRGLEDLCAVAGPALQHPEYAHPGSPTSRGATHEPALTK